MQKAPESYDANHAMTKVRGEVLIDHGGENICVIPVCGLIKIPNPGYKMKIEARKISILQAKEDIGKSIRNRREFTNHKTYIYISGTAAYLYSI